MENGNLGFINNDLDNIDYKINWKHLIQIENASGKYFDYPNNDESETEILNQKLAEGAASEMKSKYSCDDIKRICEEGGLLIYENIGYKEINQEYFNLYNSLNLNNKILASKGVSYCLLVKK